MLGRFARLSMAATVAALLAMTGTADAAPVKAKALFSTPPTGIQPQTGQPVGGRNDIRDAIVENIGRTPKGQSIQGTTWTFSDVALADALIAAAARGVKVEVIVAQASVELAATQKLQAALGPAVVVSKGPARASTAFTDTNDGTMHTKSWTFSRVGKQRYVSIVTSANVTDNANTEQFNDGYQFVRDPGPYTALRGLFGELRAGALQPLPGSPFKVVPVGKRRTFTISPWNTAAEALPGQIADPVVARIQALPKKAVIRAGNAQWTGARGRAIAQALIDAKTTKGADVKVLHNLTVGSENLIGADVLKMLQDAGIPERVVSADPAKYLHGKFMIAKYRGQTRVWTGSENWSDPVRASDELVAMLTDRKAFNRFNSHFTKLWTGQG